MSNESDELLIEMDGPRKQADERDEPLMLDIADRDAPCVDCKRVAPIDERGRCMDCAFKRSSPYVPSVADDERKLASGGDVNALARELSGISQQSADDAAKLSLDSVARGRATMGVGFSSAEGYIEALKRGVAPRTLREYVSTLQRTYKRSVASVTAPDGGSYTITLDGESFTASMLIAAQPSAPSVDNPETIATNAAALKAIKARSKSLKSAKSSAEQQAADEAKARELQLVAEERDAQRVPLVHGQLVAGAGAEGHGILVGWTGSGDMTRAEMLGRLDAANVPREWAFDAKDPAVQLTRAVRAAGGADYNAEQEKKSDAQTVEAREWSSRWMLVRRVAGADVSGTRVGQTFGEIALCVTLYTDNPQPELVFDEGADAQLVEKVREEFFARIGAERYVAADVTKWLATTIKQRLEGVRYGGNWYVPRRHRETAERIQRAFVTWGADWMDPPLPIATSAQLAQGLANGLKREVDDELRKLEAQRANMQKKHGDDADVGETAAQNMMTRLRGILTRVAAYEQLLGIEPMHECHEKVKSAIAEVDKALDEETKSINERFQNIWEEVKRDINRTTGEQS